MLPFLESIQSDLARLDAAIIDNLYSDEPLVEDIGQHLIHAGGKRLRPILVLLSANALSYTQKQHIPLAAVIEFIHTATLLHDDVVDVSSLRRGQPTANEKWGNAPSVLVGDFLYSRAFQIMVEIGNMNIMQILSRTTNVIAEGEVQQLAHARKPELSQQQYLDIIYKKTAALFEAACECGAKISGANDDLSSHLKAYGYHLGLAFQLMDDILDYAGDRNTMGKNIGDDLAEGKTTLPIIHTLSKANEQEAKLIKNAITFAELDKLDEIIKLIHQYDAIDYTKKMAEQHAQQAIEHANKLPNNNYNKSMIDLAKFAVARNH